MTGHALRWRLVLALGLATRPCDGSCGEDGSHTAHLSRLGRVALWRSWSRA